VSTPAPAPATPHGDRSDVIRIPRLPQLRPLRVVFPVALAILLWLLVVGLIGAHQMKAVLSSADWASVAGALVVVQAATIGQGLVLWGGVATYIPFDTVVRSACATAFADLLDGPVGALAAMVSLHRQAGVAAPAAYSSGLLSSAAGVAMPLLIGIGFLPVALREFHLTTTAGTNAALLQKLLILVVVAGLIGGLAFVVPRVRNAWASRGRPDFAPAWSNAHEVTSHVGPVLRLLSGPALTQVALAAGLGWCLHAVGASANFGALMVVCCAASVLGGITPVPGGVGLVEATYISGLTLAGVPQDLAAAATLLFRACTTYVPALWGGAAFAYLRAGDASSAQ
jgi:uncharacterized membrane protein YbhN (UPF0104 family)